MAQFCETLKEEKVLIQNLGWQASMRLRFFTLTRSGRFSRKRPDREIPFLEERSLKSEQKSLNRMNISLRVGPFFVFFKRRSCAGFFRDRFHTRENEPPKQGVRH